MKTTLNCEKKSLTCTPSTHRAGPGQRIPPINSVAAILLITAGSVWPRQDLILNNLDVATTFPAHTGQAPASRFPLLTLWRPYC